MIGIPEGVIKTKNLNNLKARFKSGFHFFRLKTKKRIFSKNPMF